LKDDDNRSLQSKLSSIKLQISKLEKVQQAKIRCSRSASMQKDFKSAAKNCESAIKRGKSSMELKKLMTHSLDLTDKQLLFTQQKGDLSLRRSQEQCWGTIEPQEEKKCDLSKYLSQNRNASPYLGDRKKRMHANLASRSTSRNQNEQPRNHVLNALRKARGE
jgi:hypothetical protein